MAGSSIWAPIGEQGPPGPQGPVGPIGPPGPQGGPGPDAAAFVQFMADLLNPTDPTKGTAFVGASNRIVNSVAEARLCVTTGSKAVFITSYYGDNKLGGGQYIFDLSDTVSLDNGGTVLVTVDGGRLKATADTLSWGQFGAKADWDGLTGGTNNQTSIQACFTAQAAQAGFPIQPLGILGTYVSVTKKVIAENGAFSITGPIAISDYLQFEGSGSLIYQQNISDDIFVGANAYQCQIKGLAFAGGRHQINLGNANLDRTMYTIEKCTFSLNSGFALRFFPTGGATSHLSCVAWVSNCLFAKSKQCLLTYADMCVVSYCWVLADKDNFAPNTAQFVIGSLTTDGYPILQLSPLFGVPNVGVYNANPGLNTRIANVRWCDLYKGALFSRDSRFGGESAGMCPVYNFAVPNITNPNIGPVISITGGWCFCGPQQLGDSAVVALNGEIPQRMILGDFQGPLNEPYIANNGGQIANIDTYLANFEAASGLKSWRYFTIDIKSNGSLSPDGPVYNARVPSALRKLCNNLRKTTVRRTTNQVINNALVNNVILFDTIDFDTQGSWAILNANRLVMPDGANHMTIQASFSLLGGFSLGTLEFRLLTSGLAQVVQDSLAVNTNPSNASMTLTFDVTGPPGEYWQLSVRTNSASSPTLISAIANCKAVDYIN